MVNMAAVIAITAALEIVRVLWQVQIHFHIVLWGAAVIWATAHLPNPSSNLRCARIEATTFLEICALKKYFRSQLPTTLDHT